MAESGDLRLRSGRRQAGTRDPYGRPGEQFWDGARWAQLEQEAEVDLSPRQRLGRRVRRRRGRTSREAAGDNLSEGAGDYVSEGAGDYVSEGAGGCLPDLGCDACCVTVVAAPVAVVVGLRFRRRR